MAKILIVDDNNSSIKLISKILEKHNILYDSSNLCKDALDRIRKGYKYDLILLDELHRAGAETWGKAVKKIIETNKEAAIIGFSATPIRFLDNNRDMVEELLEGNCATPLSLSDAIVRKVLPNPVYVSAIYNLDKEIKKRMDQMEEQILTKEDKKRYMKELEDYKKIWQKENNISDIIRKHLTYGANIKFIVFCENNVHLTKMIPMVKEWFKKAFPTCNKIKSYIITSQSNNINREINDFQQDNNKDEIAAVIVEPVAANMGVVLPRHGFLEFLRDITKENGSLLIFDEVITGFRLSIGGAQEYFNIKPDLTTLGKIVGGGMPVGAYGGRADIMRMVSPDGPVYQAGTLSGNPIATAAGLETLRILRDNKDIYDRLETKTKRIADSVRKCGAGRVSVNQIGSLMSIFFTPDAVEDYDSAVKSDTKKYAEYFGHMLDNGIYIAPSQFEAMFVSDAHTNEDINRTIEVMEEFFRK